MEVILKENGHLMPWALFVKPSGLPGQDLYTQLFLLLILGLRFN